MALTFPTDAHVGNVKRSYSGAMLCSMGTSYAEAETCVHVAAVGSKLHKGGPARNSLDPF